MADERLKGDEYWDKVDPDVTGDGSADGAPDDRRPNVGELGPDKAEEAREARDKWEEENLATTDAEVEEKNN